MADLLQPSFPVYDVPVQIVEGLITDLDKKVDEFTGLAEDAIAQLESFNPPTLGTAPTFDVGQIPAPDFPLVPPPDPKIFGTVDQLVVPNFDGIPAEIAALASSLIDDLSSVPVFTPNVGAPNIPDAPPNPVIGSLPEQPTVDDVAIPAAPDINDPGPGNLIPNQIPDIPVIGALPTFNATIPTFTDDPPSAVLSWSEPIYDPLVRTQLATTIAAMMNGDFAMPPAVLTALMGASRDNELLTTRKAVEEARSDYASRGFDMPPGMLVENINAARQDGALRENARVRDNIQKQGDWANDNLKNAVTSGIALEAQLLEYFNSFAQRTFDAAKFVVDSQRQLFDSKIALYNARNGQLNILCTVFQTQLDAVLAPLKVVQAQLQVQQSIGQVNELTLRAYSTRVQALGLIAQRFETLMNGAKIASDIQKNKVDIWRGEIDGFTASLNAQKIPYEIYDIRVRGEATKATVLEAEARAFAATVEAFTAKENVKIAVLNGELKAIDSATQRFVATVQAQRDRIQAQSEGIRAEASAYTADIGRFSEILRFTGTQAQIKIQAQESNVRNNLAFYDTQVHEFDASAQRVIALAGLNLEGIKAAGNITAQLSAGAMSARHVQASISGSGSASTSSSYSYSEQHSFDDTQ